MKSKKIFKLKVKEFLSMHYSGTYKDIKENSTFELLLLYYTQQSINSSVKDYIDNGAIGWSESYIHVFMECITILNIKLKILDRSQIEQIIKASTNITENHAILSILYYKFDKELKLYGQPEDKEVAGAPKKRRTSASTAQ